MWVQDYQLQLVPKMLRMLRPDLTIGFFLHIPFPPVELFMQMPWRTEIIEGQLGADLVGFQLSGGAQNFLYLSRQLLGRRRRATRLGVRSRFGEEFASFESASNPGGRRLPLHRLPTSSTKQSRDRNIQRRAVAGSGAETRQPPQDPARRGQARLHQGHRCPAGGPSRELARRGARRSATTPC